MSDGIFSFSIMPSLVEVKHSSYGTRMEKKNGFLLFKPAENSLRQLDSF
jgi:hypothetical protein